MRERPCEHVAGVWTIDGHRLPFRACLTFKGPSTTKADDIELIEAAIDHESDDLSDRDHSWLHANDDREAALQPDLCRAAADTYNLLRYRHG